MTLNIVARTVKSHGIPRNSKLLFAFTPPRTITDPHFGTTSRLKKHQERYCPERAEREPQGLHEVELTDTDDPPASQPLCS